MPSSLSFPSLPTEWEFVNSLARDLGEGNLTLEYCGTGGQGHVFGNNSWVVKIRRRSLLGFLGAILVTPKWLIKLRPQLDRIVLPFSIVENVSFVGPQIRNSWQTGTELPDSLRQYRAKRALLLPRLNRESFVDREIDTALLPGGEGGLKVCAILEEQVQLLEELRSRGLVMFDFIMKNFARYQGRLHIADPGLILPYHCLWEPARRISYSLFRFFLLRDYARLFKRAEEQTEHPRAVRKFAADYQRRIRNLAKR